MRISRITYLVYTSFSFLILGLLAVLIGPESAFAQGCNGPCPASVGNPIAASFATEGYYVMGDLVWQIAYTDFGLWAPLVYILSAFGGLVMMAMGQPPRNYLWFFLGPAIYKWLIFTFEPVQGVAWRVASVQQDQKLVWKLAEVGLLNTNYKRRTGMSVDKDTGPGDTVPLPMVFVWADELISAQVQELMKWTGIYHKFEGDGNTNTHQLSGDAADHGWHILVNNKWPMLENITAATMHDVNMRESFIQFHASECGDILAKNLDQSAFHTAATSKGAGLQELEKLHILPASKGDLKRFKQSLEKVIIPVPRALREIAGNKGTDKNPATTSIHEFDFRFDIDLGGGDASEWRSVSCYHFFMAVAQMFRYQAGLAYNQFVRQANEYLIDEENIVYDFLYGWDIKEGNKLSTEEQKHFIQDLILVHMFRNELAFAPSVGDTRFTPADKAINYTEAYQRNVGSKNKYGELYTWVKLMPYVQGTILYIITLAYPFICIVMIIPGWHKIMFTWLGFFAWVKSWDVGFAVVMALEKSIWASVGNSIDQRGVNERVYKMQEEIGATIDVTCDDGGGTFDAALGCPDPFVLDNTSGEFDILAKVYDSMLVLGANMDMDLKNSYYIYIMSALYFGVPAVTGQIFLGAKAGVAGMASNMVSNVSQQAGNAAGAGYTGDVATRGHNAQHVVGQEAFKKALGKGNGASLLGQSYDATYGQHAGEMAAAADQHQASQQEGLEKVGASNTGHANERHRISQAILQGGASFAGARPGSAPGGGGGGGKRGGAGGGGRAGGIAEIARKGAGGLFGVLGKAGEGASLAGNLGLQMGDFERNAGQHALTAQTMQARAGYGKSSFGHSQRARGQGVMAGRYQQAAQQQAAEAQWAAMRNWSRQVTGTASALGVFAGAFHAGPKPAQIDGMAGLGMLGRGGEGKGSFKDGAKKGFYNMAGQWQSAVGTAQGKLIGGDHAGLKFQRIRPGQFKGSVLGDFGKHAPTMGAASAKNEAAALASGVKKAKEVLTD